MGCTSVIQLNVFWFFRRILTVPRVQEYVLQRERIKALPFASVSGIWRRTSVLTLPFLVSCRLAPDTALPRVRFWVPDTTGGMHRVYYTGLSTPILVPRYPLWLFFPTPSLFPRRSQMMSYITHTLQKHFFIFSINRLIWWVNLEKNYLKMQ